MAILGGLLPPTSMGRGRPAYDAGSAAGPTSYLVGTGVTLTTSLTAPTDWQAWVDDASMLRTATIVTALVSSISAGVIKTLIWTFTTLNNAAANIWAEQANAGNYALQTFRYRAVGN